MNIVLRYRGRPELTAEENLAHFIKSARENNPFSDVDYESNAWDITKYVKEKNRGHQTSWVHYCSFRDQTGNRQEKEDFLREPFLEFAKAAFAEIMRRKMYVEYRRWIVALQAIEQALIDNGKVPSVVFVTPAVMDRAADLVAARLDDPWSVGRNLERLVRELINPGRLSVVEVLWNSPFKYRKARRNDEVNRGPADSDIRGRLPDPRAILALGEIYATSTHVPDKIVTCFAALAMFAPSRGSEILSAPLDCIRWASEGSETVMGLAWEPSKGGSAMTKFAASEASEQVAKDAIEFLTKLGRKAREAAAWYALHPDSLFLPPGMEHLRGEPLTLWEVSRIIGRASTIRPAHASDPAKYNLVRFGRGGTTDKRRMGPDQQGAHWVRLYTFESVERYALSKLAPGFPILDDHTHLLWQDALFCLPANILRPNVEVLEYIPENISIHSINHQLGSNPGGRTVFSRNNKLDPDGVPWSITSHQFRHLLNTLAQSKYLSQALIAFWSGRKDIRQNAWYDHIPQEAFIEAYLKLEEHAPKVNVIGPLNDKVKNRSRKELITYDEALRLEIGAIHVTRYGLCRHDYSLTPCPKDKNCINCGEHYVVKGDLRHAKEAEFQVVLHARAVELCRQAVADEIPASAKWLDRHEYLLSRWQQTLRLLQDPAVENHTIITLPPPEQSQAKTGLAHCVRQVNAHIPQANETINVPPELNAFGH